MTEQENKLMPDQPLQPSSTLRDELQYSQTITLLQERLDALEEHNARFQTELERLRASEERYKSFIAVAGEGIWRFDFEVPISTDLPLDEQVDCVYQYAYLAECNDVYAQMYGYNHAEVMIGFRLEQITPDTAFNRAYLRRFLASDYRLLNGKSHAVDHQGNPHTILNNLVGIVENSYLVCAWGTQQDLTTLKQGRATELEITNQCLPEGDHLIKAVTECATALLSNDDFDRAVNTALKIVGTSADDAYLTVFDETRQMLCTKAVGLDGKLKAAITKEQEKAAPAQAAQLAKANEVLKRSLDVLATEPKLECFLRHVLSVIVQQMNVPGCLLWLFDDLLQTATLHSIYTAGQVSLSSQTPSSTPPHIIQLRNLDGVFHTNQRLPYLLEVTTPPFPTYRFAYLNKIGVKAILIVPLWLGDRSIGSFSLRLTEVRTFPPCQLELLQALAHQTTLALQLTQLTEQASQAAVLEERNRMTREIHDILAQAFTGVVMHLEAAKMIVPQDSTVKSLISQAQELARSGLAEVRRSVWSLRPQTLENADLPTALEQLVQNLARSTLMQIHLQIQGVEFAIVPEVETQLLRITQEALTNALKYSHANNVKVKLSFGKQMVKLSVRDDGQGFNPNTHLSNGFGLVSMQERTDYVNGKFTIQSQPERGTSILVTVAHANLDDRDRRLQ